MGDIMSHILLFSFRMSSSTYRFNWVWQEVSRTTVLSFPCMALFMSAMCP